MIDYFDVDGAGDPAPDALRNVPEPVGGWLATLRQAQDFAV